MQHEITNKQDLLDEKGCIVEAGWARHAFWKYDRNKIHAQSFKIKEWDYYLVANNEIGMAFTISDLGYLGMGSVSLLNFLEPSDYTKTEISLMPLGKMKMGSSPEQVNAYFSNNRMKLAYKRKNQYRIINCSYKKFINDQDLSACFWLQENNDDNMCIATSWKEKQTAFYYNQKTNCMPARGWIQLGDQKWELYPKDTMGTLDWGRGVWTYDNVWYWGTGSGWVDNIRFGFNLGYGFSDRSVASENVIFYDGKVHKLENVEFQIPSTIDGRKRLMEPWKIVSSDSRFDGVFVPLFDRKALLDFKLIVSDQHQVFGHFTGIVVLDDGRTLNVKDFLCAVEVVHNKY